MINQKVVKKVVSLALVSAVCSMGMPVEIQKVVAEESVATDDEENDENAEVIETTPVTVPVPIYNYDIANVVLPTSYAVALNPYELPIKMNDGTVSTAQVVSQNYGIINKSTRDKIVTAVFTVEDENEDRVVLVDSKEDALKADKDTYAIYLSVIPADSQEIKIDGDDVNKDTSAESLTNVTMSKAKNNDVVLHEGENSISFKLSRAVYDFGEGKDIVLGSTFEENEEISPELADLAADNEGVTAFTFDGMMNPNADWTKLTKGVNISVTYSYVNALGDEIIADGTGAMIEN